MYIVLIVRNQSFQSCLFPVTCTVVRLFNITYSQTTIFTQFSLNVFQVNQFLVVQVTQIYIVCNLSLEQVQRSTALVVSLRIASSNLAPFP